MALSRPASTRRRWVPRQAAAAPEPPLAALAAAAFRWSFVVTPAGSGAANMALDHALLRRAAASEEAVLRLYTWSRPTLSLGRHQTAASSYDRPAIRAAGLDAVRRPTGGRAVLHDHEVTYSVTAPTTTRSDRKPGERRQESGALYRAVNALLVDGLRHLGADAAMAAPSPSDRANAALDASPCFDTAVEGEVIARGRKLVGSAQWRENGGVLQHGSILLADDQHRLAAFQGGAGERLPRVGTLTELLGRTPTVGEVAAALVTALGEGLMAAGARPAVEWAIDPATRAAADALRPFYESDEWTWRR